MFLLDLQGFIKRLFNVEAPQAATILMTLAVVVLGFLLNALSKMAGRRFERSNTRKLTLNAIEHLANRLTLKIKDLKETIESFNFKEDTPFLYPVLVVSETDVFRQMKYQDLFNAFFTGIENYFFWSKGSLSEPEKLAEFNRLWNIVAGLDKTIILIEERRLTFDSVNNGYRNAYNESLTKLRLAWSNYLRAYRLDNSLSPREVKFRDSLVSVIHNYATIPLNIRVRPYNTYHELVFKILALTDVDGNDADVNLVPLIEGCLEAITSFQNLEGYLNANIEQFKIYRKGFEEYRKKLIVVSEVLGRSKERRSSE